jgi:MFS family permease
MHLALGHFAEKAFATSEPATPPPQTRKSQQRTGPVFNTTKAPTTTKHKKVHQLSRDKKMLRQSRSFTLGSPTALSRYHQTQSHHQKQLSSSFSHVTRALDLAVDEENAPPTNLIFNLDVPPKQQTNTTEIQQQIPLEDELEAEKQLEEVEIEQIKSEIIHNVQVPQNEFEMNETKNADKEDETDFSISSSTSSVHPDIVIPTCFDDKPNNTEVPDGPSESQQQRQKRVKTKTTPLPKGDMMCVMAIFLCEGVSYTFAGPFIGYMILDFGLVSSEDKAGYFAGFLAGTFSIAQFFTSILFGILADKVSKKTVVLISTIGCIGMVLMFGFSPNIYVAVLARALHGGLNGNVATVKAHLADMTDETNQAMGYSLLGLSWAIGAICGPVVGGYLAKPVEKYGIHSKVFSKFHYALPCIFVAGLLTIGFVLSALFMSHSRAKKIPKQKDTETPVQEIPTPQSPDSVVSPTSTTGLISPTSPETEFPAVKEEKTTFSVKLKNLSQQIWKETKDYFIVIMRREVIITVFLFFMSSTIDTLQEELFPLWAIIEPSKGGIAFTTNQIGTVHLVIGCLMLLEPLIFPVMAHYIGSLWSLRIGFLCIIPLLFVPQIQYAQFSTLVLWLSLSVYCAIRAYTCFLTFTAVYILINNAAPPGASGRVMSLSNSAGCVAKVIAPFSAGPLLAGFAQAAQKSNIVVLNIPFLLCSILSFLAFLFTFTLSPSINEPKRSEKKDQKEEEQMEIDSPESPGDNAGLADADDSTDKEYNVV